MAVTPAQLIAPIGALEASLFPGEDISADGGRLAIYIAEAMEKPAVVALAGDAALQDRAVTAWAMHRAFDAVNLRLSAIPTSVQFEGQGGHSYSTAQIQSFADRAAQWLRDFYALTDATEIVQTNFPPSSFARNRYA